MPQCNFVKISNKEWAFIEALEHSISLNEIAKKMGLPYITVYRLYKSLKSKSDFYFMVDFRKMNLLPLYLFFDGRQEIKKLNGLTVSLRKVYGTKAYKVIYALVPYVYKDEYIESYNPEPLIVVQGLELTEWKPSSGFSVYFPLEKVLLPVFSSWMDHLDELSKPVPDWVPSYDSPDSIDLAILLGKYRHPFNSIVNIIRSIRKYDPTFPIVSKQVLSYHYRNHVLKYWLYNTVNIYFDARCVPFRFFYFEGPESHIVARILVNLPSFYWALIDKDKALVLGQPPGYMFENIYKIISTFDVEIPLGDLIMSLENMRRLIPLLWKFVENNRWVWRDLTIKVPV